MYNHLREFGLDPQVWDAWYVITDRTRPLSKLNRKTNSKRLEDLLAVAMICIPEQCSIETLRVYLASIGAVNVTGDLWGYGESNMFLRVSEDAIHHAAGGPSERRRIYFSESRSSRVDVHEPRT